MQRQNIPSGSPWEDVHGYSRAVRVGNMVFVSGTTGTNTDGSPVHPTDMYLQAKAALEKVGVALTEAGATYADVVRTTCFIADISRWEEAARAHCEVFGQIKPAATMVEVAKLIAPNLLIEFEVTAIVGSDPSPKCPWEQD